MADEFNAFSDRLAEMAKGATGGSDNPGQYGKEFVDGELVQNASTFVYTIEINDLAAFISQTVSEFSEEIKLTDEHEFNQWIKWRYKTVELKPELLSLDDLLNYLIYSIGVYHRDLVGMEEFDDFDGVDDLDAIDEAIDKLEADFRPMEYLSETIEDFQSLYDYLFLVLQNFNAGSGIPCFEENLQGIAYKTYQFLDDESQEDPALTQFYMYKTQKGEVRNMVYEFLEQFSEEPDLVDHIIERLAVLRDFIMFKGDDGLDGDDTGDFGPLIPEF